MTKEVFLSLLTEEGLTVWEAGTFWEAQVKHFPETIEHLTAADVRALGREVFPASKRLRDLQRARGATHRPDL